jgi:hypothetical protein
MNKKPKIKAVVANEVPANYKVKLILHITDGGARYLTDNDRFAEAKIIIRLDGGAELCKCEIS